MVTSKLTAAAVQAQISSQKQRLAALEANLGTMESGMDKHMVQVRPVHGYWLCKATCALPSGRQKSAQQCLEEFIHALEVDIQKHVR
jgi:hypothetical protein